MADVFDKCTRWQRRNGSVPEEDREIALKALYRTFPLDNAGPSLQVNGRRMLQFSSNDYLGLANHPRVRAAATEIVSKYGIGAPMGARPVTGNSQLHIELERRVANFKRTEAALVFSSGSDAMMGTIAALAGRRDRIVLDEYAHASLAWGAKISGAEIEHFAHNDVEHLESILRSRPASRATMVVVNGVYSMQGDLAPLPGLCDLCERHGARLVVDDAHGTGVCGDDGRGTAELLRVEERIDLHLGTFSKAVGTTGGFAAGDRFVIEFLKYRAPSILFTKAMPACIAAATLSALELLGDSHDRRAVLWKNAQVLQEGMRKAGFSTGSTQTPITPIRFKGAEAAYYSYALEQDYGIRAASIFSPAVPHGSSVLRLTPTASHGRADIERLLSAAAAIREATPRRLANSRHTENATDRR